MQAAEWTMVVLLVVIVGVNVYITMRNNRGPVTVEGTLEAVRESIPIASELRDVAQIAVNSAEQFMLTGDIKTNNDAYKHAYAYMRRWFPAMSKVSDDDINNAIHDAVLVANFMSNQIKVARDKLGTDSNVILPVSKLSDVK